jgi:hypothetical protein
MSIPYSYSRHKTFYENLADYTTLKKTINCHEFLFIIEKTKPNYKHACSVEDIEAVVAHIPPNDYGNMKFFVLRQPKRKEEILSPVWGRLVSEYTFANETKAAIIIEALDYTQVIKWSKKLSVEDKRELERLISDGHRVADRGRNYTISYNIDSVRNTQLYRTIPHEFGHHVHYTRFLGVYTDKQWEIYPKLEKEKFAHAYAKNFMKHFPHDS